MGKKERDLSPITLFMMGGALFSMHFGASSMIWPMTWGRESGSSILPAFFGIFLTALFLPLLGYVALSRGKGTYLQVTSRISPKFAQFFCGLTIIILGPLYVIPRMSAAAWDAFSEIIQYTPSNILPIAAFSTIYYIITYWFIASRSKTVDRISKILFPVLVVIVIGVISKGLLTPVSSIAPKTYESTPVIYGFLSGMATGELPCALVFGIIILDDLKSKGVKPEKFNVNLAKVGVIGIGMLTLTHFGHMLVGALTGTELAHLEYSSLYTRVVIMLWGQTGGILFSIALIFAALTTAIGLTASTANYFEEATKGKLSYRNAAILILIGSTIISSIGLGAIVKFVAPLLDSFYPGCIVLTVYYTVARNCNTDPRNLNAMRFGVIVAFIMGLFDGLIRYNEVLELGLTGLRDFYHLIPLAQDNLAWVTITLPFMVIGWVLGNNSKYAKGYLESKEYLDGIKNPAAESGTADA